ncbi:MAG TPA: hypothetical protein DCZ12_06055 [Gammaproteobacteria bacterium]|nr:hypothetical protein [Gammaproteobacteria bacterium]
MFMIRNKVWPIILLAYREAFSSQLLWVLLLLVPLTLGLAELLGTMALTEKTAIKAGFSAGLTRWAALFIACLFTITSIARERDNKLNELLFSLSINRSTFYLSKFAAYGSIGLLIGSALSLTVLLYRPTASTGLWIISLYFELLIMVSFSLMVSVVVNSVIGAASVVLGFYLLARSIEALLLIANSTLEFEYTLANQMITLCLTGISWLLPKLNQFAQIDSVLSSPMDIGKILHNALTALAYVLLTCLMGLIDLSRKRL